MRADRNRTTFSALDVAAGTALFVMGVLLGVIGAFLVPQRIHGGIEGLSVVIALVGNAGLGLLAARGMRESIFAALPGAGWFAALCVVFFVHPGGDIILPGKLGGDPGVVVVANLFMLAGILGSVAAVVVSALFIRRHIAPTPSE